MPSPASESLAPASASSGGLSRAEAQLPRMAMDIPFAWLLLLTGAIAWLASGALVLEKLQVSWPTRTTPPCATSIHGFPAAM
jgi:hypothetical protein